MITMTRIHPKFCAVILLVSFFALSLDKDDDYNDNDTSKILCTVSILVFPMSSISLFFLYIFIFVISFTNPQEKFIKLFLFYLNNPIHISLGSINISMRMNGPSTILCRKKYINIIWILQYFIRPWPSSLVPTIWVQLVWR